MKKITNVEVIFTSGDTFSAHCHYDGARYHAWFIVTPTGFEPQKNRHSWEKRRADFTLYKNPINSSGPGYFKTRRLDQSKGIGLIIMPQLIAAIPQLLGAAKQKVSDAENERREKARAARKEQEIKEAGPELFAALSAILRSMPEDMRPPSATALVAKLDSL